MKVTVQKMSARAQARAILIERIVQGDLAPGVRLNETALAGELQVSQTPVREALLGLEGQGYVTSEADRGFFVKPLLVEEVRGIYPVLGELEALALSSVSSFTKKQLGALDAVNKEFALSMGEQSIELDNEWHHLLLSGCDNHYLLACIDRVRNDAHRYENMFFRDGGNIENASEQHRAIINLLKHQKRDLACKALRENCLHGMESLCAWLEATKQENVMARSSRAD